MAEAKWDGKKQITIILADEEVDVFIWTIKMWGLPPVIDFFNSWLDGRRQLKNGSLASLLSSNYNSVDPDRQAKVRELLGIKDDS